MSLVVARAVGLVTVQDVGRPGHMHEGLAPGGAMVPELLAAANRRVRNPDGAAAIEVMGALTVRAETAVTVATDVLPVHELRTGEELTVVSDRRRVTYLALRGGIGAPVVLGSRSTQLSAGLGQMLSAGARLEAGSAPVYGDGTPGGRVLRAFAGQPSVLVIAGPDLGAFTADALTILASASYTVLASSNRVGTRLGGPTLPRTDRPDVTRPMVRGAIEVPRDGQPIVLGPEHPTTGGYPLIGVIACEDLGSFFAIPSGDTVRFVIARGEGDEPDRRAH
jgi:allophanate hydrolase subunit 2